MPKAPTEDKSRRLRASTETVRERAFKSQQPVIGRLHRLAPLKKVFRPLGVIKNLPIWRPFKAVGRFLGKILVPPYLRSSFRELRQVTWPDRKQSIKLTGAVLLFALIFGTIVAIVDFGLDKLFKEVILR